MSGILTRARLIAQERYDLEDFNADQAAIRSDSKFWTKRFLSGENYIIRGFEVSGLGLKAATISMEKATLIHGENSFDFSWFTSPEVFTNIVIPDADLQDGVKNYIEIKLLEVTNTPVTKAFWDPAANGGAGAEFNQEVDTMIDLEAQAEVVRGGFSGSPDRIPLAIVDVDGSGNIVGILDQRKMYFRLAGTANVDREFTWNSQEDPTTTLTLSSVVGVFEKDEVITFSGGASAEVVVGGGSPLEIRYLDSTSFAAGNTITGASSGATATVDQYIQSFVNADKDIQDFKENDDAIKTEIKKIKGTRLWHQNALNSISGLARFQNSCILSDVVGAQWRWNGSELSISQILQPEITRLIAVADVAGSLDAKYFITYDQNGSVGWWIDVDDSGTAVPAGALTADRQVEITTIATGDSIATVASKLQVAINADAEYIATVDNDEVTITDVVNGERQASVDGDTGFTISRVQRGLGNLSPADADILAKLRILGELGDLDITRQDGSGGSTAITVGANQVVFIELPTAGSSRAFSGVGVGNTNFQVVNIEDYIPGDDKYWVAIREDEAICIRGGLVLGVGEEVGIGGGTTDDTISYIGAAGPNDPSPQFISTEIIDQGDNLTLAIGKLDQKVNEIDLDVINKNDRLRVKSTDPDSNRIIINPSSITQSDGSVLGVELDDNLLLFNGAQIDLETGEIFEADGVTPFNGGANDFVPASLAAGEYVYYGISISPRVINADDTVTPDINVTKGSSSNANLNLAPKAQYGSATVSIASLYVQESGGGIAAVAQDNIQNLLDTNIAVSSTGTALTVQNEGIDLDTAVDTINFQGSAIQASQTVPGTVNIEVIGGEGTNTISNPVGEDFDGIGDPVAVYAKNKKTITFSASDNVLEFDAGTITLNTGVKHTYPYTALKSEIETKMSGLGYSNPVATLAEQNWKLEIDGVFSINRSAANSATTKMGFVTLDTSVPSSFFRADAIHQYTLVTKFFKTNTDDDLNPPYIDNGLFNIRVPANHRSRYFCGFVSAAVTTDNNTTAFFGGELNGFGTFTDTEKRYLNGTAGQISPISVENSLFAGSPRGINDTTLITDPLDKNFFYIVEPDTDVLQNTVDGLVDWEASPLLTIPETSQDVTLHACGASGDNFVFAQVTDSLLKIGFSTEKGLNQVAATINGGASISTRVAGSWNNTDDFFSKSPAVAVDGNNVFVAYAYHDGSQVRVRGLYGTIAAGALNLVDANSGEGAPYTNSLSSTTDVEDKVGLKAAFNNGSIYVFFLNESGNIEVVRSVDLGNSFTTQQNVKNGATPVEVSVNSPDDFVPYQVIVDTTPGQVGGGFTNFTNGDFGTGDLTGWNNNSDISGQAQVLSNQLQLSSNGIGQGKISQVLTTQIGVDYRITFSVPSGSLCRVCVKDTNDQGKTIAVVNNPSTGNNTLTFTATSVASYIEVSTFQSVVNDTFDADVRNWVCNFPDQLTFNSGRLRLTGDNVNQIETYTMLATEPGETYFLSFELFSISGNASSNATFFASPGETPDLANAIATVQDTSSTAAANALELSFVATSNYTAIGVAQIIGTGVTELDNLQANVVDQPYENTFDTGIAGITPTAGEPGNIVWNASTQRLRIQNAGTPGIIPYWFVKFPTVVGRTYTVEMDLYNTSQTDIGRAYVFVAPGSANGYWDKFSEVRDPTFTASAYHVSIEFVATESTMTIGGQHATNLVGHSEFDNVLVTGTNGEPVPITMTFDNFEMAELGLNRVAVITGKTLAGSIGNGFRGLFYTDVSDLSLNWETAIDLGENLNVAGDTNHLPAHLYYDKVSKTAYLHCLAGHNTNDGSGALARTGDTNKSGLTSINLNLATPAVVNNGSFTWPYVTEMGNGNPTDNNNGVYFVKSVQGVFQQGSNILVSMTLNDGNNYLALVRDLANMENDKQIVKFSDDANYVTEGQIGLGGDKIQLVTKEGFVKADVLTEGKVKAAQVSVSTVAKTEELTNGDFATGDLTGWTDSSVGSSSIAVVANELVLTQGASGSPILDQVIGDATPGRVYELLVEVTDDSLVGSTFRVYNGQTGKLLEDNISGVGSKVISFRADSSNFTLRFTLEGGTNDSLTIDNISLKVADLQFFNEKDIIEKPNIDEEGFAGRALLLQENTTVHVMAERELDGFENLVYNNYGIKTSALSNQFRRQGPETTDEQFANTTIYGSDSAGAYAVVLKAYSGVTDKYFLSFSRDGGDSYQTIEVQVTNVAHNNTDDYFDRSPAVAVDVNGNVAIAFLDFEGGVHKLKGRYGQIDLGGLTLSNTAGIAATDEILASGNDYYYPRMVLSPNGNMYCTVRIGSTDGPIGIAVSDDNGASWTAGGGSVATTPRVKSVGSNVSAMADSSIRLVAEDDPDNPGNDIVLVLYSDDTTGDCKAAWTRNANLNANWETELTLQDGAGTSASNAIGIDLSPNGENLAVFIYNGNDLQGYLNIIDLTGTPITTSNGTTGVDITDLSIATHNGYTASNVDGKYFKQQDNKLIWTTDTSLMATHSSLGTQNGLQLIKVSDVSNIAANTTFEEIHPVDTAFIYGEEILIKNGSNWNLIYRDITDHANALTEGRIINKKLEDSTPTVNDPVTYSDSQTLSNTQDHSFYAARIQGKGTSLGNIVFFEATNALGFEGVFSNIRKDRIGTSDIDLPITTGGAAPGSWLATPVNFHNTVTNYFAALGAPGDSGNFTAASIVSLSSLRFHNTPDTGTTLNSDFDFEGTSAYPSAGADFYAGSPYIHHIGGNEFFVAHNKTPDYNTEVNKLSFPGGVPTKGAGFTAISGVAGFGSASYINSRGSSVVFLGRITSGNHTARINYSSDGGATLEGECDILDAPAGAAVNSNSQFPAAVFICDDGAAGDRVIVIGTRWNGTNGTQVFLAHTNNPEAGASAQWENLIDLDGFASNNTCILGYRRFGDQLAILMYNETEGTNKVFLRIVTDMTAATPTLGPIVDISDGVGAVDMFNGYVSESQKGRFHKHSMQKISWTSANSLIATWAQGNDIKVAVISDTNNIAATTTNVTAMDASSLPAGEFYTNGQMVDNGTGSYEVIAEINDTDNTTNEQVGRLVARSIDASGNLGIGFTDIGNKPATVAGGELSKAFARGNMVTFTKENGTSDQNTYFNKLA